MPGDIVSGMTSPAAADVRRAGSRRLPVMGTLVSRPDGARATGGGAPTGRRSPARSAPHGGRRARPRPCRGAPAADRGMRTPGPRPSRRRPPGSPRRRRGACRTGGTPRRRPRGSARERASGIGRRSASIRPLTPPPARSDGRAGGPRTMRRGGSGETAERPLSAAGRATARAARAESVRRRARQARREAAGRRRLIATKRGGPAPAVTPGPKPPATRSIASRPDRGRVPRWPATSPPGIPPLLDERPRGRGAAPEADDGADDPAPAGAEHRAADARAHDRAGARPVGEPLALLPWPRQDRVQELAACRGPVNARPPPAGAGPGRGAVGRTPAGAVVGPSTSPEGLSRAGSPSDRRPRRGVAHRPPPRPATGGRAPGCVRMPPAPEQPTSVTTRMPQDAPQDPTDRPEQGRDEQAGPDDDGVPLVACSHGILLGSSSDEDDVAPVRGYELAGLGARYSRSGRRADPASIWSEGGGIP